MKIQLSRARLAAHITELACAFHVEVQYTSNILLAHNHSMWEEPGKGIHPAGRISNTIIIPNVVDEMSYACALHELGHACHPAGQLQGAHPKEYNEDYKLEEERAAWAWAKHYALVWTKKMQESMDFAYGTHVRAAEQAKRFRDRKPNEQDLAELLAALEQMVGKVVRNPSPRPRGSKSLEDLMKGRKP